VIALSGKELSPAVFRATISAIFLVQGSASLVAFGLGGRITRDAVSVALAGLPGVIVGSIVGERGFRRLDTPTFRKVASGCSTLRVSWRC
jgi:uncharacterized membrane protein YfcA